MYCYFFRMVFCFNILDGVIDMQFHYIHVNNSIVTFILLLNIFIFINIYLLIISFITLILNNEIKFKAIKSDSLHLLSNNQHIFFYHTWYFTEKWITLVKLLYLQYYTRKNFISILYVFLQLKSTFLLILSIIYIYTKGYTTYYL